MRRDAGGKFYIEAGDVFKANGEVIPSEEPIFILRGRDKVALDLLKEYHRRCLQTGCNTWQLEGVERAIGAFRTFSRIHQDRMKEPGVTKGG